MSSPPKDPSPGSASQDFKRIDTDYQQETISSDPQQLDLNIVYNPQPISSFNPNLSPQPISSFNPNLSPQSTSSHNPNLPDPSTIYSQIDPETEYYIKCQGLNVSDVMNQKETLDYWNQRKQSLNSQHSAGDIFSFDFNIADPSTVYSEIDPQAAAYIKSQGIDMPDIMNLQKQSLDYWNHSLPQDPAGISRTESPVMAKKPRKEARKERAGRWLKEQEDDTDSPAVELTDLEKQAKEMESEKEIPLKKRKPKLPELDQKQPEKLNVKAPEGNQVKEEDGFLLPFSESEREDDYETLKFLLDYVLSGRVLAPEFDSGVVTFINEILAEKCKVTVSWYQYRKKVTGLYQKFMRFVQQNGGKDFSQANFFTGREYEMAVMCKTIWNDAQGRRESGFELNDFDYDSWDDPGLETGSSGSYDSWNDSNDPIIAQIKACFGPTPAPVTRVSATGKKLIIKPPRAGNVEMKSTDAEFEADMARAIEMSLKDVPEGTSKGIRIEDQPAPKIDTLPDKKRKIDTLAEKTDLKVYKRRKLSDSRRIQDENRKPEEEQDDKLLLSYTNNEAHDDYDTVRSLYCYTVDQWPCILHGGTFVPNFENAVTEYINRYLPDGCKRITTDKCRKKVMELHKKFLKFMELNGGRDLSEADFPVSRDYQMFRMSKTVWNAGQGSGGSGSGADQLGSNVEQGINDGNVEVDQGNVANPGADDGQVNIVADVAVDQGNVADPGADGAQVKVANMAVDVGQENVDKMEVDGSSKN